jgi:hypothetical protein
MMQAPVQIKIENSHRTNSGATAPKLDNNVDESKDDKHDSDKVDDHKHHQRAIGVHQTHHFIVNVGCGNEGKNS